MERSKLNEERVLYALTQAESGMPVHRLASWSAPRARTIKAVGAKRACQAGSKLDPELGPPTREELGTCVRPRTGFNHLPPGEQ